VAIAKRQVRGLKVRVDVSELRAAVDEFRNRNGHYPSELEELAARGYIARVPFDPDGGEYGYDPRTGSVYSGSGRVLGDF
jgi:hypothetical protein